MASISFVVNPKGKGTLAIRAKFSNGAQATKYKNLGYCIPDNKVKGEYKHWDAVKHRVKNHDKQLAINKKISYWTSEFENYIEHCQREQIVVDIDYFKNMLDADKFELPTKANRSLLLTAAREFYQEVLKTHKPGTHKQYKTMIENIEGFEADTHRQYTLSDVNKEFYKKYGLYLIEKENNYNNTVNRKIGRILTVMQYAFEHKLIDTLEFKHRYSFKNSAPQRFALWPAEIALLKKVKVKSPSERKILDAFLFSCETTLRFSDVIQLYPVHKKDITTKTGKFSILDLTQEKTINANTIALTDYAQQLWMQNATDKDTPVFQILSTNYATPVIKDLCKAAKLNREVEIVRTQNSAITRTVMPLHKAIGFHMARNTAITSQLSKLAPAYVMDNAGIKKMETLMGYYRDDDMARYKKTMEAMNSKRKPRK